MTAQRPGYDVLRLITRLNIGGPARQALLLTKELGERWPTLLAAGTPPAEEGELTDPAVPVHRLPLVRPVSPVRDIQAWRQASRLVRTMRPKIVHTHMAKAGMIGRGVARRHHDVKTVHTYHGHVLQGYFKPATQRGFLEIERRLARVTDVLIAISPQIKDELLDLGIGRPEQFRTIPLGFDLSDHLQVDRPSGALRSRLGLSADVPLVGCVGRLVPIKDLPTLFRAMARIEDAHLAVLGDGESRSRLERLAHDLQLAGRIHFTGWYSDVAAAMSDLDLVVLSSSNEGTPVSLIEAGACARAVVATDVGGVGYVVEHGTTGLLCPPGESQVLAGAIRSLIDDADKRARMGAAARQKVRALFHKDRLLKDIAELYSELVG